MLPVTPYPLLRISLFFMAGISFQYFSGGLFNSLSLIIALTGAFLISLFIQFLEKKLVTGILIYSICFFAGAELFKANKEIFHPEHFSNFGKLDGYIGVINNELNVKPNSLSAEVKINYVKKEGKWIKAKGKVLLYFTSKTSQYQYGDVLAVKGTPISVSADPSLASYKGQLEHKQIYQQQFLRPGEFTYLHSSPPSLLWQYAFRARAKMSSVLQETLGKNQEYAVASMIILGIRQQVDRDLQEAYSMSGAMHVLAVSGMHVGVIFAFLNWILGWLTTFKFGKHFFYLFLLFFIWTFGFITAFSPSVQRAVVMFSIVIIGKWLNKKGNLFNTLGLTALVVLTPDPEMLFNIGFQMSFMAVFGIAFLNPMIQKLYAGKSKVLKWFWDFTCVSLSAQLFTFPLALYYFNQFPTYFLISNIWIIPLSSLILYAGIAFFAGVWVLSLKTILGSFLKFLVMMLNKSMFLVSYLPGSVQKTLYFETHEILIIYLIIIFLFLLFYEKKKTWIYAALVFAGIFSVGRISKFQSLIDTHQIEIGEIKGKLYITLQKGDKANIWLTEQISPDSYMVQSQLIKPLEKYGVNDIKIIPLNKATSVWQYQTVEIKFVSEIKSLNQNKGAYIYIPENKKKESLAEKVNLFLNKGDSESLVSTWNLKLKGKFTVEL